MPKNPSNKGSWLPAIRRTLASTQVRAVIEYRRIHELKLNPKNPRSHPPQQIRQLAKSIETFGFVGAVIVDADSNVVIGHGRVLSAQKLGMPEVPTIQVRHLSKAKLKALMLADNRLTENSVWDDQLLAEHLKELSVLDLDFNIEATGFDTAEIDLRIGTQGSDSRGASDSADAVPEVKSDNAVSKPGDLWRLGNHLVLCGSALEDRSYRVLLDGRRATMVFTDPPYNVPIEGNVSGLGSIRHREFAMGVGEMDSVEFQEFLRSACANLVRYSTDGSIHFICMDWRHIGELYIAGLQTFAEFKNLCVWAKSNAGMGSLYRSQHELVFVFKNGRATHRNNVRLGQYGRNRTNVWTYPNTTSFGRAGEEGHLSALHPTVKPVAMVADAIFDCSGRGEIVLDPFLGSGTTLIAAERTGRRCFGVEIDPLYVDTIIRRWQTYGREQAIHVNSGRPFDELALQTEASHGA